MGSLPGHHTATAETKPNTLNRSPQEQDELSSLCGLGFVGLYRAFHGDGRPGFNSGTPPTNPPDARLHLILGPTAVASEVSSACVDLEYRAPIDDLPDEGWAPGVPVILDIADSFV